MKDTASGKYLVSSSESPANVFLELQHSQDKEKSSRPSVFIPTVATRDVCPSLLPLLPSHFPLTPLSFTFLIFILANYSQLDHQPQRTQGQGYLDTRCPRQRRQEDPTQVRPSPLVFSLSLRSGKLIIFSPSLLLSSLRDAVSLPVTIGGEITVEPHTISTSPLDYTSTAFVVELGLFCKDKPLQVTLSSLTSPFLPPLPLLLPLR